MDCIMQTNLLFLINPSGTDIITHSASTIVHSVNDSFHTYSLVWTDTRLAWYVDDKLLHYYDKADRPAHHWPFNGSFYLLLTIAVGRT